MWSLLFALYWFGLCGQFTVDAQPCPFLLSGTPLPSTVPDESVPDLESYKEALKSLCIKDVFADLYSLMTDPQECWPPDELNGDRSYAGLFLRLAWHSAGTFRATDGAGGSFGARQRYAPESSWDDNVNLDKARALLGPIKDKYGDALSWGDLMIFAGTAAILNGGGPVTQVCAGRLDDRDGSGSQVLNTDATCANPMDCGPPLGASIVGLIYVNPQGFLGVPDPNATAANVREIFGRMGMNDTETVALIGGGHAFGKCHGACPLGAGPGPDVQPNNPWPGLCGQEFPQDTFTSGIEGAWTPKPFEWDNVFFTQLRDDEYDLITGPGGAYQWKNRRNGLLMLTTDIAFVYDDKYKEIVDLFAGDQGALDYYFSKTWEKLVTSGGNFAKDGLCVDGDELRPDKLRGHKRSRSKSHDKKKQRRSKKHGQSKSHSGGKHRGKRQKKKNRKSRCSVSSDSSDNSGGSQAGSHD